MKISAIFFLFLCISLTICLSFGQKINDKRVKNFTSYYKSGQIHFLGNYIDSCNCEFTIERSAHRDWQTITFYNKADTFTCLFGNWKVYYENGKLRETGQFDTTSQLVKYWIPPFNEDGSVKDLKVLFEYRNAIISSRHGLWKFYDQKGKLIRKTVYNKGEIKE